MRQDQAWVEGYATTLSRLRLALQLLVGESFGLVLKRNITAVDSLGDGYQQFQVLLVLVRLSGCLGLDAMNGPNVTASPLSFSAINDP